MNELDRFDPLSASNLGAYSFIEAGSGLSDVPAFPLDDLALDDLAFLKIDEASYNRLISRGKLPKVALVAALSKLLGAVFAVVRDRKPFLPDAPGGLLRSRYSITSTASTGAPPFFFGLSRR